MKVLITGTSGFIGSRIFEAACDTWGPDNMTALSSRPMSRGRSIVYHADFMLDDASRMLLEDTELLIHAGAFTPKSGALANDVPQCNGNVFFTGMLLNLPLAALRKVIFLSTVDVYAPADGLISEESTLQPTSLYGWSKLYCEQMVKHYGIHRNTATQILRIGHVYGPGEERYYKFLPNAMRNIVADKSVELWGEGKELRSLIYIDDVVRSVLNATATLELPDIINVVGDIAFPVRIILERAIAVSGRDIKLIQREFSGSPRDIAFNTQKLKKYLLAKQTVLDDGLRIELAHMERITAA